MNDNGLLSVEFADHIREDVAKLVDESGEMALIRKAIEERGLDQIWVQLISEFGALMYIRGRQSSSPLHRIGSAPQKWARRFAGR
jgi:hypothetical protein